MIKGLITIIRPYQSPKLASYLFCAASLIMGERIKIGSSTNPAENEKRMTT